MIVLQSGTEWGTFQIEQPVRGGGAPPTPPPRIDSPLPDSRTPCALAFNGNFEHTLDAKHRLTVPSKFRTQLAGPVFLVKGVDRCISVYPEQTYSAMTDAALAGLNPFSPEARELRRVFFRGAPPPQPPNPGRAVLP